MHRLATSTVNIAETANRTRKQTGKFYYQNLIGYLLKKNQVIWINIEQVTAAQSFTVTHFIHSYISRTKHSASAFQP